MDQFQKLTLLSENLDVEEGDSLINCSPKNKPQPTISYAKLPNGKSMPLLKSMITSVCENNCYYCAFRAGRDCQRASFTPDEMADTFTKLNNKNIAKGLFLSSGIAGSSVRIQDKIIDTAAILRKKLNYQGYMHLKIMPGAEFSQIENLMLYADRVSINLEAPNRERLSSLAPKKDFYDALYLRLSWAAQIRDKLMSFGSKRGKSPSITTQFVVGPSGESDYELLKTSVFLINTFRLARIYFMTFRPVLGTPLAETAPEDPLRGHRLYQSSFLMRDYGFHFEDFAFLPNGNLRLDRDPKQIWAEINLSESPLEINRASRSELLRIPGIGPKRVKFITEYRQKNLIRTEEDLKKLGIPIEKSGKYMLLNGRRALQQLPLFAF